MHIRGGALSPLHSLTYYRPTDLSLDRSGRADEAEEEEEEEEEDSEEEDSEEDSDPFLSIGRLHSLPMSMPLDMNSYSENTLTGQSQCLIGCSDYHPLKTRSKRKSIPFAKHPDGSKPGSCGGFHTNTALPPFLLRPQHLPPPSPSPVPSGSFLFPISPTMFVGECGISRSPASLQLAQCGTPEGVKRSLLPRIGGGECVWLARSQTW